MTRFRTSLALLTCVGLGLSARRAWGHAELISPRPRSAGAQKTGPCGGVVPTGNPTYLLAGSMLKVDYKETIDHPGSYRIAFAPANDTGFDQNVLAMNLPDIQGNVAGTALPPSEANPRNYSSMVRVPTATCQNCTLQLIQYMTENTPPTLYYSCADIRIVTTLPPDGGVAPGSDAGTVTPGSDAGLGSDGGDIGNPLPTSPASADGGVAALEGDGGPPAFCVLSVAGASRSGGLLVVALALLALMARRRRFK